MTNVLNKVALFFKFKERSATFKKEIIGGISTFLAMAYILAVNPGMLSKADTNPAAGIFSNGYEGVFFLGTALIGFIGTMAMGLKANLPVAVAPGMGVNAFFTYTVAGSILGMSLEEALIATFISGILYAVIAITPARNYISKILPKNMKLAIGAMIGLFLAYIGLMDSGIIVSGATPYGANAVGSKTAGAGVGTATKLGNFKDPFVLVAITILILVFVLHFLKVKGAAIIAIIIGVILLAVLKWAHVADIDSAFKLKSYKSFGKFGELSKGMWSSFGSALGNGKLYIAVFVFLYVDFFDTTGTLFSVGEQAGLNKDKKAAGKWLKDANLVDAGSTILGSVLLTSTATSYVESTVGVSQGARTGFASVITALGFGLAIAIWPIMTPILPIEHLQNNVFAQGGEIMPITGPVLVLVGALMLSQLKYFEWKQTIDIPVLFVTLTFGMLGYSISTGIAAGVVVYYIINAMVMIVKTINPKFNVEDETIEMAGPVKDVTTTLPNLKKRVLNPAMIIMFVLAVTYFATMPLYAY